MPPHLEGLNGSKTESRQSGVDWNERDQRYHSQIMAITPRLLDPAARPRRITANSIGLAIGLPDGTLPRDLDKLPHTATLVSELTETHEQFALRRIRWVKDRCINQRDMLTRWQFMKCAGLSEGIRSKVVMAAVDQALREIHASFHMGL